MTNVKSFIQAGGEAHWEFLVFKHNEHQVEEARNLAREMGFKEFYLKKRRRAFLIINKERMFRSPFLTVR